MLKTFASAMSKRSDTFMVESIVGHQIREGKDFYKVHWLGYSKKEETWEPIENLNNCHSLVEKFMDEKSAQEKRRSLRPHRELYHFSSDDEEHNTSKTKRKSGSRKTTVRRSTRASATPSKKVTKDDSTRSGYNLRSGNTEFSSEDESSFVVNKSRSSKKTRMTLSESRFKKQLANIKKDIYQSSPYKTSTPQVSPSKTSKTTDSSSKIQATKRLQFDSVRLTRTGTVNMPTMRTRHQKQHLQEDIAVSEEPPTVGEADDSEEEEVEPPTKSSLMKAASQPVSKKLSGDNKTEEEQCFPVTWKEFALASFVTGVAGLGYLCYMTGYCRYC